MDGGNSTPDCVRVDFACNSESGSTLAFVRGMTIGRSEPLEFEAIGHVHFAIGTKCIWVGGQYRFATLGQAHWVGSMAWDGFWMPVSEAERLLILAHRHKWFTLSSGESILFQQWRQHAFGGLHLRQQLTLAGREQVGRA